jgi:hypothetical protein
VKGAKQFFEGLTERGGCGMVGGIKHNLKNILEDFMKIAQKRSKMFLTGMFGKAVMVAVLTFGTILSGFAKDKTPVDVPLPDENSAVVHFVMAGKVLELYDGTTPLTQIKSKQRVAYKTGAGVHNFVIQVIQLPPLGTMLQANLEAGKTYYIFLDTINRFAFYQPWIEAKHSNDPDFKKLFNKNKLVAFNAKWASKQDAGDIQDIQDHIDRNLNGEINVMPSGFGE